MRLRAIRWTGAVLALVVLPLVSAFAQPAAAPAAPAAQPAAPAAEPARPPMRGPVGPPSPEILPDGQVALRLAAPKAAEVTVSGDWRNGANGAMTKNEEGIWSATIGPLAPELYTYSFSVDGARTLDPRNPRVLRDGGRYMSALLIPGPGSALYDVGEGAHGTLAAVWYPSPTLSMTRRMYVYTPPGYENGQERFPVLYLLHGAGGDEEAWNTMGRASQILDGLIVQGKAKPMIVVMTNGNATQRASQNMVPPPPPPPPAAAGAAAPRGPGGGGFGANLTQFTQSLVSDVIPFVDKSYRTLADRENRAIAGLSMGGAQTMFTGLNHLDKFSWVASFSGAFVLLPGAMVQQPVPPGGAPPSGAPRAAGPGAGQRLDPAAVEKNFPGLDAKVNSQLRLLYLACGLDDNLLESHRQFKEWLKSKGVSLVDIETPGYAHVWSFWRLSLADLAARLFQPAR